MNWAKSEHRIIVIVILSLTVNFVLGGGNKNRTPFNPHTSERFQDITKAISLMHKCLPGHLSTDEKCKRYSVLSIKPITEKVPYETALSVAMMESAEVNAHYDELDESQIIWNYMIALDRYRVTQLAPPFLEILECLRRINTAEARRYLDNPEIVLIANLYRRALGLLNESSVDMVRIDFDKFHESFKTTVRNLFRPFFEIDESGNISMRSVSSRDAAVQEGQQIPDQLFYRREQARVAQHRLRVMHSEALRQYHADRRKIRKMKEQSILAQPELTPAVLEAKRLVQEKRDRINERRKKRRMQRREELVQQRLKQTYDLIQPSSGLHIDEPPIGWHQMEPVTGTPIGPSTSVPREGSTDQNKPKEFTTSEQDFIEGILESPESQTGPEFRE